MAKQTDDDEEWPELHQLCVAVGARVRELREQRGMTQKDLAAACDLKQPYVYEIERGGANATLKTMLRLALALNIEPRDLLPAASSQENEAQFLRDAVHRILRGLKQMHDDEMRALSMIVDKDRLPSKATH